MSKTIKRRNWHKPYTKRKERSAAMARLMADQARRRAARASDELHEPEAMA